MQEDGNAELEEEVASGLELYFDKALGQMLLYSAERPQFEEQVPSQLSEPSTVDPVSCA